MNMNKTDDFYVTEKQVRITSSVTVRKPIPKTCVFLAFLMSQKKNHKVLTVSKTVMLEPIGWTVRIL